MVSIYVYVYLYLRMLSLNVYILHNMYYFIITWI